MEHFSISASQEVAEFMKRKLLQHFLILIQLWIQHISSVAAFDKIDLFSALLECTLHSLRAAGLPWCFLR